VYGLSPNTELDAHYIEKSVNDVREIFILIVIIMQHMVPYGENSDF
jgi:hypothetical protein